MTPRPASLTLLACLFTLALEAQQPAAPVVGGGSPAVSPDGRWIAFGSNRDGQDDLYLVSPDGALERRLTDTPAGEGLPQWRADGGELYYAPRSRDSLVLHAIRADGTGDRVVTRLPGRGGVVSPDGRRLLRTVGPFTSARLVVSALDGTDARVLGDTNSSVFNAAWSPDGSRIAYTRLAPDRSIAVWVINADGSGARQVTHLTAEQGRAQWPAWSPDGGRIAVQVGAAGGRTGNAHLAVVDLADGTLVALAPHDRAWLDETPSWLPDGRIAFQSDRSGRMEIWVMNPDGTRAMQVTGRR